MKIYFSLIRLNSTERKNKAFFGLRFRKNQLIFLFSVKIKTTFVHFQSSMSTTRVSPTENGPMISNGDRQPWNSKETSNNETFSCEKHCTTKFAVSFFIGLVICGIPLAVIASLYGQKRSNRFRIFEEKNLFSFIFLVATPSNNSGNSSEQFSFSMLNSEEKVFFESLFF